jgi:hypothetical protein
MHIPSSHNGSALAISLVILTAITLISVTTLKRSGIQGRMVGNIQHQEWGFNTVNSDLGSIYHFYSSQASATDALSIPSNNFTIVSGKRVWHKSPPGHPSNDGPPQSSETSFEDQSDKISLEVTSTIKQTGAPRAAPGFSFGSFLLYQYIVESHADEPNLGFGDSRTLSSQDMGVEFIGPNLNN